MRPGKRQPFGASVRSKGEEGVCKALSVASLYVTCRDVEPGGRAGLTTLWNKGRGCGGTLSLTVLPWSSWERRASRLARRLLGGEHGVTITHLCWARASPDLAPASTHDPCTGGDLRLGGGARPRQSRLMASGVAHVLGGARMVGPTPPSGKEWGTCFVSGTLRSPGMECCYELFSKDVY